MGFFQLFQREGPPFHPRRDPKFRDRISSDALKNIFDRCDDLKSRSLVIGTGPVRVFACWLDGLVSGSQVSETILRPLTEDRGLAQAQTPREAVARILSGGVYCCDAKQAQDMDTLARALTEGCCALVFDSLETAVCFEARSGAARAVEQPSSEKAVKGAKDAFTETLRTNVSLIRRRLRSPALKLRQSEVGRKSGTHTAILYLDGVADPKRVQALSERLDAIDIDGVTAAGQIEDYITDAKHSPFPQLMNTERPDRFAANLLEGRVGLLVDGLPMGFLAPVTLPQLMKVPDDAAQHWLPASALSALRYLSFLVAAALPALFTAISMYHQEMIPTKLLLSMIAAKQEVPFGVAGEVLNMLIAFELLQEAGLRLPNSVGQTVSIIGALIVGQSAVEAKVVSPVAVIIVSVAGICGFTIPDHDLGTALRLCRVLLVLAAIAGGMYGIMLGTALLVCHLASIENFGVDYLSPLTDRGLLSALRALLRPPLPDIKFRDRALDTPDRRKQK